MHSIYPAHANGEDQFHDTSTEYTPVDNTEYAQHQASADTSADYTHSESAGTDPVHNSSVIQSPNSISSVDIPAVQQQVYDNTMAGHHRLPATGQQQGNSPQQLTALHGSMTKQSPHHQQQQAQMTAQSPHPIQSPHPQPSPHHAQPSPHNPIPQPSPHQHTQPSPHSNQQHTQPSPHTQHQHPHTSQPSPHNQQSSPHPQIIAGGNAPYAGVPHQSPTPQPASYPTAAARSSQSSSKSPRGGQPNQRQAAAHLSAQQHAAAQQAFQYIQHYGEAAKFADIARKTHGGNPMYRHDFSMFPGSMFPATTGVSHTPPSLTAPHHSQHHSQQVHNYIFFLQPPIMVCLYFVFLVNKVNWRAF